MVSLFVEEPDVVPGSPAVVVDSDELTGLFAGVPGLSAGTAVELRSGAGRTVVATTTGEASDARSAVPPGVVALNPDQQTWLRTRGGDTVELVELAAVPVADRLEIIPLFPIELTPPMRAAVVDRLTGLAPIVRVGMRFRLPLTEAGATGLFEVAAVRPEAAPTLRVSGKTQVGVQSATHGRLAVHGDGLRLADVGGAKEVIAALREAVELPLLHPHLYREMGLVAPRGVLLYGPPGSGKTHLCRALAGELGIHVESISGPELVSGSRGQTEANLREAFEAALRAAPSIVVIDEIDAVAPDRRKVGAQADYRMVAQLLAVLDGLQRLDGVVVVATTNNPDALDPALRRPGRLDQEIVIGPPDEADRREILELYFHAIPLAPAAAAYLPTLAARTFGFLPADLMALARGSGLRALARAGADSAARREVTVADMVAAQREISPTLLRGLRVTTSTVDVAGLALPDGARSALSARLAEVGAGRPLRLLVTMAESTDSAPVIGAVARELGAHLLEMSPADLLTSWLGETEGAVHELFALAGMVAPALIALPRIDGVAGDRRRDPTGTTGRIISQLAYELDGLPAGVHIVASTDAPELLDPAIRARFTSTVELRTP